MDIRLKLALLGDGATGKTSLVRQYLENKFSDDYISTIGCKVSEKTMAVETGVLKSPVNIAPMNFYDLHGQRGENNMLLKSHLKGTHGAMIVLDATREETFHNLQYWIADLEEVNGPTPYVILLNKMDLIADFMEDIVQGRIRQDEAQELFPLYLERTGANVTAGYEALGIDNPQFKAVWPSNVEEFAKERGVHYFQTSAKTGDNVEEAVQIIARAAAEKALIEQRSILEEDLAESTSPEEQEEIRKELGEYL